MEEKRIGVYVCWCGTNISLKVNVEEVAKEMEKLPNVIVSKNYKYMCSDPGQDLIIKDIKEHNLNRIIVAACSPRIHELTFRKALEKAGLNPYYFEMANIREHVSWVHNDWDEATRKAKSLIAAAINRVIYHESLDKRRVDINPATLIIGGGISGMSSALEIADAGRKVFLTEKSDSLGGIAAKLDLSYPYMTSMEQMLKPIIDRIKNNPNIEVFLESEIKAITGYVGNFETILYDKTGKQTNLKFGNVVVATGLKQFEPSGIEEYGYGKLPDVITSLEFEKLLKSGEIATKDGKEPKNIAIIHCVGSRNQKYHEYCSRTCCTTALKFANQIRTELPKCNIFDIYADMRTFGKGCEELYANTSKRNIKFFMFDQENELPKIYKAGANEKCNMFIEVNEKMIGKTIEVPADMVILMIGMEAHVDVKEIAHAVSISTDNNKFFIEKHPKLDPVATTTDGIYIVGSCHGPKDIPDSVAQARAASARILGTITQGSVEVETTTAEINELLCCGCQTCIKACPYSAIKFDLQKKVSIVNEVLCKGCGTCGAACPTGAIKSKHFTDRQILAQIEGMMHMEEIMETQNLEQVLEKN